MIRHISTIENPNVDNIAINVEFEGDIVMFLVYQYVIGKKVFYFTRNAYSFKCLPFVFQSS